MYNLSVLGIFDTIELISIFKYAISLVDLKTIRQNYECICKTMSQRLSKPPHVDEIINL